MITMLAILNEKRTHLTPLSQNTVGKLQSVATTPRIHKGRYHKI